MRNILTYKLFENNNSDLEIGDYVYVDISEKIKRNGLSPNIEQESLDFFKNNIGIYYKTSELFNDIYVIEFENIPKTLIDFFSDKNSILIDKKHIIDFDKNKDRLKQRIKTKEFNI